MTFIASVLSQNDENNSGQILSDLSFTGTGTKTIGYNSVIVSIENSIDSISNGIIIEFSDDNSTFTTYFTDTYTANEKYEKSFQIIKEYYRVSFINFMTTSPSVKTGDLSTRLMTSSKLDESDNNLVLYHSVDDATNSTKTLLSGDGTYNGTSRELTGYNTLIVSIISDVSSKPNGLEVQFSDDNSTFETFYFGTYNADVKYERSFKILKNYYKIIYTNGNSTQSEFNLTSRISTSSISSGISNDVDVDIASFNNDLETTKDAFNKLRVSNPFTLLDIKFPIQSNNGTVYPDSYLSNNVLIDYKETGTGTITKTYGNGKAVYNIQGDGSSTSIISQSRKYCTYQPGKSLLFLASGVITNSNTSTNYEAYIGYFDNENGCYFMNDSGTFYIGLRNSGSDTTVEQTDWNIDTLDGNGPSGVNLDFSKTQLFILDMEWLGVGRIRYGFYLYGKIYYCHTINNINELIAPYMQTANLPIRYQLKVEDSGQAQLTQICSTVISEGGYNPIGRSFSANNGLNSILIDSVETNILAITGNDLYVHQNIVPTFINIIAGSNDAILYNVKLIFNATNSLSSSTWNDVDTNNSVIKYAVGSDISIVDGTSIVIDSSYAIGKNTVNLNNLSNNFNNLEQLTSTIDNVADIILISAQKVAGGSTNVFSSISWQEIY